MTARGGDAPAKEPPPPSPGRWPEDCMGFLEFELDASGGCMFVVPGDSFQEDDLVAFEQVVGGRDGGPAEFLDVGEHGAFRFGRVHVPDRAQCDRVTRSAMESEVLRMRDAGAVPVTLDTWDQVSTCRDGRAASNPFSRVHGRLPNPKIMYHIRRLYTDPLRAKMQAGLAPNRREAVAG